MIGWVKNIKLNKFHPNFHTFNACVTVTAHYVLLSGPILTMTENKILMQKWQDKIVVEEERRIDMFGGMFQVIFQVHLSQEIILHTSATRLSCIIQTLKLAESFLR